MPPRDPPRLVPVSDRTPVGPSTATATLAETVDHLIARGIVLQGEVAIAVAGTELVRLDLSAVLRAAVRSTAAPLREEDGDLP